MQTKRRILQSSGQHSLERTFTHRYFKRNKRPEKNEAGGGRPGNDFLKKVFRPISATRFNPLFNGDNYDCLYASAKNCAALLGSHFDCLPDKKDFTGLFRYLESLLPDGQHLFLMKKNNKLLFKVFFGDDFLINEVFFIPLKILNRTEGAFRDIILTFFQHFQQVHRFPKKEDLYDYEIIVDCYFEEWYDRNDEPEVWNFLEAYKAGYIHDTFSLVYQKPVRSIEDLEKHIESYPAENEPEQNLIVSIRQGINILLMNKNIFEFVHRPEENDPNFYDADDDCTIVAERLIRFVYSGSDYVTENYIGYINTESADCAHEYFPRNFLILSPETDRLLEVDFVECFFSWLKEFIIKLYDYEEKQCQ